MASPASDHQAQAGLQGGLPRRRVRLHHDPDLPIWPDRLHDLLQGRDAQRARAHPQLHGRAGGVAAALLQCRYPQGQLRPANLCAQGLGVGCGRKGGKSHDLMIRGVTAVREDLS